jgi:hypothetical protein
VKVIAPLYSPGSSSREFIRTLNVVVGQSEDLPQTVACSGEIDNHGPPVTVMAEAVTGTEDAEADKLNARGFGLVGPAGHATQAGAPSRLADSSSTQTGFPSVQVSCSTGAMDAAGNGISSPVDPPSSGVGARTLIILTGFEAVTVQADEAETL